jgi:phage terminase large subunit-like protein
MTTASPPRLSPGSMSSRDVASLDDFADFCADYLTLDNGAPMVVEDFQRKILGPVFDRVRETLVLLPKKNGKSTTLGALAIFHLLTTPDADCIVVAASREQAEIILRQARGFVRRSPALSERLVLKQREIVYPQLDGRIQVRASDVDTVDGWLGTLALIDELHRHKSPDLYGVLRDGLGGRDGQLVTISTAGADQNSVLWRMRHAAIEAGVTRDGSYTRGGTDAFVLHEWSLQPDADLDDIDLVKTANPLEAMTVDRLRERHDSPSMVPWQWARFACNVWTQGEEAWLPIGVWDSFAEPGGKIPDGSEVWVAADLGLKHDTAAIVVVAEHGDGFFAEAKIIKPPTDGTNLDIAEIEKVLRDIAGRYRVHSVAYDPWRMERSAQLLGDEGLLMVEHPMTNARMAPESEALHEAIMRGMIRHSGDTEFSSHVNAGVPTETERGWRLTKRRAKDKIDALIALLMAYDLAQRNEPPEDRSVYFL